MPLSNDKTARKAQLANLRCGPVIHGAHSEPRLRPLRECALVELEERFPSAASDELVLLAHRRAQLELLAAWQDERGLFQNRQRGIPFPAVGLHRQIACDYERQYAVLAEREHARRTTPALSLEQHLREHYGNSGQS